VGELAFRLLRYTTRAAPGALYARLKRRVIVPLYTRLRGDRLYRTTFFGGPFWLPATSSALNRDILLRGAYEPEAVQLFRSLLKPGMTVWNVGANIGYYTVLAAEAVSPTGRVFALEPDPRDVEIINRNLRARGLQNVVVAQVAVSDHDGEVDLHFSKSNPSINSLAPANTGPAKAVESFSQAVPGTSLDSFLARHGDIVPDILKIDVQGAELLAFRGAQRLLAAPRLRILLEFWPHGLQQMGTDPTEFLNFLLSTGFVLRSIARKPPIELRSEPEVQQFISAATLASRRRPSWHLNFDAIKPLGSATDSSRSRQVGALSSDG
jgi:FkbM family methyltransferase